MRLKACLKARSKTICQQSHFQKIDSCPHGCPFWHLFLLADRFHWHWCATVMARSGEGPRGSTSVNGHSDDDEMTRLRSENDDLWHKFKALECKSPVFLSNLPLPPSSCRILTWARYTTCCTSSNLDEEMTRLQSRQGDPWRRFQDTVLKEVAL